MRRRFATALSLLALAACADATDPAAPDAGLQPAFSASAAGGSLYTMTNAPGPNEVLAYRRGHDGTLAFVAAYETGGTGTGSGLGNQGGVVLSGNGRWLVAVNAGSNDVTVFARRPNGMLERTAVQPSGGTMPISTTIYGSIVYVLNAGGDGNIAGFELTRAGRLEPIAGSIQALSQPGGTGPAQIEFANHVHQLVVTEKATNRILVYPVDGNGVAGPAVVNASVGTTPFGFAMGRKRVLIVSNAAGGAADAGSMSSYAIRADGTLETITGAVPNFESAPCWVAMTRNRRFAYTTNTASHSTSGYAVRNGQLDLLDDDGVTATNSGGPIDAAVNVEGPEYLYVLNAGAGAIDVFAVGHDGSLTAVAGGVTGLPTGTNGLAAR